MTQWSKWIGAAMVALGMGSGSAAAQGYYDVGVEPEPEPPAMTVVEVTTDLGVLGRSTTGIGEPLTEHGYDREPGLAGGLEARFLFGDNRYARAGFALHGLYQSGPAFGLGGRAYRLGLAEATFAARALLPCISNPQRQLYASAWLGVSAGRMNAGFGRGAMSVNDNERRVASEALDHSVAGWVLGASFDARYGAFLVGLRVDLRHLYGVDTVAERTFAPSAMLRFGVAIDRGAPYRR